MIDDDRQARIDALMLEFCPDEMTEAQKDNWAKHQRPVSEGMQQEIDSALMGSNVELCNLTGGNMGITEEIESIMRDLKARREVEERKRDDFVVKREFASAGNQEMIAFGMQIAEIIVRHHHMDQFREIGRKLADVPNVELCNLTGGRMYPGKWTGSTDPNNKRGVAEFKTEGVDYALYLDCFTDHLVVSEMLEAVFNQGKRFAATAMRSKVTRAMDQADSTL